MRIYILYDLRSVTNVWLRKLRTIQDICNNCDAKLTSKSGTKFVHHVCVDLYNDEDVYIDKDVFL